jgi:hypothetical protein
MTLSEAAENFAQAVRDLAETRQRVEACEERLRTEQMRFEAAEMRVRDTRTALLMTAQQAGSLPV